MYNKMPDYKKAMALIASRKIVKALAEKGGIATFSEIVTISEVKSSLVAHHLNRLQSLGVIEREVKGTYRLRYKTPLCYIFDKMTKISIAYFGLLGKRKSRSEPETSVALELLSEESINPKLKYVVTSLEALNAWKELKLPYQWILCYEDEIIDIEAIKNKVTPQLESLLKNHVVIMDCTSATKPATIAYYELAQTYCIPLIYVYEKKKKLKWLISKETIKRKFLIL